MPGKGEPAMNEAWGQLPMGGVSVYAVIDEGLPEVVTAAVPDDELRPRPEGTEAILPIKDELNGRIEGFGSRFWTHVLERCRGLEVQFEQKDPLKRVSYSDRYITTPWALVLLREILLDLVRQRRADPRTELEVLTRDLRNPYRPGRVAVSVSDSFQDDAARESVFDEAMGSGRGSVCWSGQRRLEVGLAPHFRELRLEWKDGSTWSLFLDQGVGYWQCRPRAEFPFKSTGEEQVTRLNQIVKRGRVTSVGTYPTYVYVTRSSPDR